MVRWDRGGPENPVTECCRKKRETKPGDAKRRKDYESAILNWEMY